MTDAPKNPQLRAAEVLIEYAAMIEEGEIHRSGPLKGKCAPEIQEEIDEYRALAAALVQPYTPAPIPQLGITFCDCCDWEEECCEAGECLRVTKVKP